ncbi:Flagellar cap protein FliD [hydrothermal vent metagenome]|uniref:Filament cap protein n=1 Tax=hydrothermal vent metagenome TaxID=652676 RepID=A0A3B1AWV5_9ZZZZ
MASITASGIGSGLDINSIISQIMALEQRPLLVLQQKEVGYQSQLSALGQLRSAAASYQSSITVLKSASSLQSYTATSADTAKFTATADSTAAKSTYDIQVTNLAEVQKQGSNAFADSDTVTVGSTGDKITATIGSSSFSVEIGGKTLSEIAEAINSASDNVGITASVLQETSSSYRLMLSSDDTGIANSMTLAFEDSGGLPIADPLGMAQIQAAEDASFTVDGIYTITRSSNTINDAIQGVTIELLEESASAVRLDVALDTGAITSAVNGFVKAYNSLQSTLSDLRNGSLSGDSTIRQLENRVRSVLNTPPAGLSGSYSTLSEVGVAFEKDGTLSLDNTKLSAALTADLDSFADLFANDNEGYAFRLDALMDNVLGSSGLIDAREDGINSRIDTIQDGVESMGRRLVSIEERYRAQFTAMDSLVASMNSTGNFLSQQFDMLSNLVAGSRK